MKRVAFADDGSPDERRADPVPRQRVRRFRRVNERWSFAQTLEGESLAGDGDDEQDCYPTIDEIDGDPATSFYRYPSKDENGHEPDELVDPNPPLSEMNGPQLRRVYENVDTIAALVEKRTIRPSSRMQQALARQAEQDASAGGAASVSLLKTASANRRYAIDEPVPWSRSLQPNQLDFANSLSLDAHAEHTRDQTVLLDVASVLRTHNVPLLLDARRRTETFRYAALPVGIVGALQESSVHAEALLLENGTAEREPLHRLTQAGTLPLGALLRLLCERSGFPLFAVYVRAGAGFVDVALSLEPSNSLFLLVTMHAERTQSDPQALCNAVCDELVSARRRIAEEEEDAQKRSFDDTIAGARRLNEHLSEHKRRLRLAASFHVDHRLIDTACATLGEQLCARSTLLTVFAPEYSRSLQALEVRVLYCAFAACQCRYEPRDLCTILGIDPSAAAAASAVASGDARNSVFAQDDDDDDDVDDKANMSFERRVEQRGVGGGDRLEGERTQAMFARTEAHSSVQRFGN